MISQKMNKKASQALSVELENGSKIVVVGAGPAGCFFAIKMLKAARQCGKKIAVILVEKKSRAKFENDLCISTEGCNFCAGGISPRLADVLSREGMPMPKEIIKNTISAVIIHNNWKNIELRVPKGRQ